MYGGGRADDSPSPPQSTVNDGELLLRLVQNRRQQPPPQQPPSFHHPFHSSSQSNLSLDPAVAAVGPSIPIPLPRTNPNPNPNPNFFSHGIPQNTPWPTHHSPSPPPPHTTSFFSAPHHHYDLLRQQQQRQKDSVLFGNIPLHKTNFSFDHLDLELNKEPDLGFGFGPRARNGFDPNHRIDPRVNWAHGSPEQRRPGPGPNPGPPPGFQRRRSSISELSSSPSEFSSNNHSERDRRVLSRENGVGLSGQLDRPGFPTGSAFHSGSGSGSGFEKRSLLNMGGHVVDNGVSQDEVDELSEQLVDSVLGENESNEKNDSSAKKKYHRDKDFRSDARGKWILSQKMRNSRRLIECRRDIDKLNADFLAIYKSLIPEKEEKEKQKQLVTLLENLVRKEWPNASLYVYGSCANSFGVSKSDIDICLALDDQDIINKSEVLLKLADILESDNLQNVQALTRARVPIVKLMDPGTGISCDICINNLLAVVNTKLLHDYAEIDVRLRQLAFLVKHWAKSRGVNETYQGTLSSYAYVLMCIHFLQLRHPPILPCLQGMEATCTITVDDVQCAYFDKVERLRDFGAQNKEGIAQLLWAFFNYWAYCHDYANSVISIRTGSILRKHEKDWTRRIGNDRHLICIEDPFETSHDLGRVVDKYSIRVLREEFERAAEIMQYDPNPCVTLFQPYVPSP